MKIKVAKHCLAYVVLLFSSIISANPIIDSPQVALTGVPFEISVSNTSLQNACDYKIKINELFYQPSNCENSQQLIFSDIVLNDKASESIELYEGDSLVGNNSIEVLWGWLSVMPPLISILIALFFRSVIPALFLGVWMGAFSILGFQPSVIWQSFLDVVSIYVKNALANPDHSAVIIFSLMIGGLVGVISKNGGMQGVVNSLIRFTKDARRGQLVTATLGLAIFFDDYANTLVVGNTMRKVTDRLKISRAKLAFLVDATAAPIACIALITTWVGYQIGMIDASIGQIDAINDSAYSIYLSSILYSFYPLFMLAFVFTIAGSGRDFGAMYDFELSAREGNDGSIQGAEMGYTNEAESKQLEPKDPE